MPGIVVYRDMNWYPTDGGTAIAPDVMTLPRGLVTADAKSYRQAVGGLLPGVAVEVASASDSFPAFHAKTNRYRALGVPVYIVIVDPGAVDVLRAGEAHERWVGRVIPELGNLSLDIDEGRIVARFPQGEVVWSAGTLLTKTIERVAALERQLRALGIDPAV